MLLVNKVVFISGAGSGLGAQLIKLAIQEGAVVVFCARSRHTLEAVSKELSSTFAGGGWDGYVADITSPDQCSELMRTVSARHGPIDILINNAFVATSPSTIQDADLDRWRNAMEVNFFGTMTMVRAALSALRRDGGVVVMVSSMNIRKIAPGRSGSAASKAALQIATQYLASEMVPEGVRVNSVMLGWMLGPSVDGYLAGAAESEGVAATDIQRRIEAQLQIKRMPSDRDCAKSIVALASDYFEFAHGACLDINAGAFIALT